MHNIDRTQLETWGEMDEFESGGYPYAGESAYFGELPYGEMELNGEYEEGNEFEFEFEGQGIFSEAEEMELAAELLDIRSEAELDQFIGKFLSKAARTVGRAIKSPVGRQIGGLLKGVAKKALPMVGGALGNLVLPGVGGAIGSQLASAAGSMFGLELEGLSPEDREFEVARRLVRLGGEAVRQAAITGGSMPPQAAAQKALIAAARQHAPGLANEFSYGGGYGSRSYGYGRMGGSRQSGRWIRRGNRIVLLGIS